MLSNFAVPARVVSVVHSRVKLLVLSASEWTKMPAMTDPSGRMAADPSKFTTRVAALNVPSNRSRLLGDHRADPGLQLTRRRSRRLDARSGHYDATMHPRRTASGCPARRRRSPPSVRGSATATGCSRVSPSQVCRAYCSPNYWYGAEAAVGAPGHRPAARGRGSFKNPRRRWACAPQPYCFASTSTTM